MLRTRAVRVVAGAIVAATAVGIALAVTISAHAGPAGRRLPGRRRHAPQPGQRARDADGAVVERDPLDDRVPTLSTAGRATAM
jgi:hypothetical protein